jgi:hypothetical protein
MRKKLIDGDQQGAKLTRTQVANCKSGAAENRQSTSQYSRTGYVLMIPCMSSAEVYVSIALSTFAPL